MSKHHSNDEVLGLVIWPKASEVIGILLMVAACAFIGNGWSIWALLATIFGTLAGIGVLLLMRWPSEWDNGDAV